MKHLYRETFLLSFIFSYSYDILRLYGNLENTLFIVHLVDVE